jgi:hypothetical protein
MGEGLLNDILLSVEASRDTRKCIARGAHSRHERGRRDIRGIAGFQKLRS